jgi:predicted AAA+ superfamily ATPase
VDRYLSLQIAEDLKHKMVFLGGPRQVGKTTLARSLLPTKKTGYLNWDIPRDRESILRRALPDTPLLVFDELHKYRKWRGYIKGVFDELHPKKKILVTGSARLDLYRYGGDSLQGRYHYLKLHPLSFAEIGGKSQNDLEALLTLGGFPEPFLAGSLARARRWAVEYRSRLIQEDIAAVENVRDLGTMELLSISLPERVGSPLSINALREDLQINHQTVGRWLDIFERLYSIFRLMPLGAPKIRAVKKERKHYHFNWAIVPDEAARYENMIACHLLKWVDYIFATEGREIELRYFRDVDSREVDFVLVEKRQPILLIECKLANGAPAPSLRYLKERFPQARAVQVIRDDVPSTIHRGDLEVCSARKFLGELV